MYTTQGLSTNSTLGPIYSGSGRSVPLKVHKIENFFDSDFGICVISLLVISKY